MGVVYLVKPLPQRSVFTYGTLQNPKVMRAVIGKTLISIPAIIDSYERRKIRNYCFPGIISRTGTMTEGSLYHDLINDDLCLLYEFEADFYVRKALLVNARGIVNMAFVYVMTESYRHLLMEQHWSLQEFEQHDLVNYLARTD